MSNRLTEQFRNTRNPRKSFRSWVATSNLILGPGMGVERVSVGPHPFEEGNKREDWMEHWMMLQTLVALNTVFRKTPEKQVTYRTPKGVEKQLDYVLINRKYMSCSRDAEANNINHKWPQNCHGAVRDQSMDEGRLPKKNAHRRREKSAKESIKIQDGREESDEANVIDERYHELGCRIKHKAEAAVAAQKPSKIRARADMTQADGRSEGEAAAGTESQAVAGSEAQAAAAHNRSEDANAAAAKEKTKSAGDMMNKTKKGTKKQEDKKLFIGSWKNSGVSRTYRTSDLQEKGSIFQR